MAKIPADSVEIEIQDGIWRVLPSEAHLDSEPAFQVARGSGVIEYTAQFAETHRLPGTRLSVEYIRAVVVGYDATARCWRLGLHLARHADEKPRWFELVHWPVDANLVHAAPAQQAARELAEHIGCTLQVFGAEKLPRPVSNLTRSGVTGPLVPHQREVIEPARVKLFAQSVKLPIQYPTLWLGTARDGITLKLSKPLVSTPQDQTPGYCQVNIDTKNHVIRLLPATGLLTAFLGGPQGREIRQGDVRNVELRFQISQEHTTRPDPRSKGLLQEITYTHYTWHIFLTLPKESLLIAQTRHSTDSELSRKRAMAGDKFSVNTQAGIEYLRQHQADQEAYETAETSAWTAAIVIASSLDTHLVKTEVNPDEP